MKRFLWNSDKEKIYWDNGKWDACAFRSDELGMFETDYRGSEPREIQSAEYNPETGRIKLVPKEPVRQKTLREIQSAEYNPETGRIKLVPKEPVRQKTLREAAEYWRAVCMWDEDLEYHRGINRDSSRACVALCEAIDRELQHPANPYTKESVDELLDALRVTNEAYLFEVCKLEWPENVRTWRAVQALLRESVSGKGGA